VGKLTIKALHTPGHTLESTTYLLRDEEGQAFCIFSGDTLFIGDVGRPDLAQEHGVLTSEDLAAMLYHSLRTKIMPLSDDVLVYPAHGAGSACGKSMSKETFATLGHQKLHNYALDTNLTEEAFIKELTDGIPPPPRYFPENVRMNREGYNSLQDVKDRALKALSPNEFEVLANEFGALLLDTRDAQTFAKGFVPNSINIGIDGTFAPWVGALIADIHQPILLICEPGMEDEVVTRLARVGYDNTIGYLEGGFKDWFAFGKEVDTVRSVSAAHFVSELATHSLDVVDVRRKSEHAAGHVEGCSLLSLDFINENMAEFNRDGTFYIHCAGGYRSMITASILKSRGIENFIEVSGGYAAIKKEMEAIQAS
jgi:rhodanese-related sulfurtransferase